MSQRASILESKLVFSRPLPSSTSSGSAGVDSATKEHVEKFPTTESAFDESELTQELVRKASILKTNTLNFSHIISTDQTLGSLSHKLENESVRLKKESSKISELTSSSWTTTLLIWGSVIVVVLTFIDFRIGEQNQCLVLGFAGLKMSDWEDEDTVQALPAQLSGQWDDEDAQEEVLESWDQEVQEPVKQVVQVSKKKNLKKKIQEKSSPRESETLEEKKERLRNEELKADLENAQDLFSGISVSKDDAPYSLFDQLHPTTAKEFEELKDLIIKKFSGFQGPLYINFIENLIRDISIDLSVDDSRRIVSTLNAMINEKQKAMKDSKKKKSGKKGITVTKGIDTTNYDDVYDEFDDFM